MKQSFHYSITFALAALASLTACDNSDSPQDPTDAADAFAYSQGAFVVNYGDGTNGSTLSHISLPAGDVTNELFRLANLEAMGSGVNDAVRHGSKLYMALSESGKIEVTDLQGRRLAKVELRDDAGRPLSPRHMAAEGKWVYFSAYGGIVGRIDTASLALDSRTAAVGDYPEAMSIAQGKLFVNNSLYMGQNVNDAGNTVSVIDLASFETVREIEVAQNPYNQSVVGADGMLYIVSQENWYGPHNLQRIDPTTYDVTSLGEATVIAAAAEGLYAYYSIWGGDTWLKRVDYATGAFTSESLLDATQFDYVQTMSVDPQTDRLYIADAPTKERGTIYGVAPTGAIVESHRVGYSPIAIIF
jgi:hypothetical protein